MHSVCGIGWGLGGKLAEESEALRDTFGPARYLISGIKSFVKLRGCPGTLELLIPRCRALSFPCNSSAPPNSSPFGPPRPRLLMFLASTLLLSSAGISCLMLLASLAF